MFIDDAHGVGVLGRHGKGICDFYEVHPSDVDILMGTYSKAFASNGGFIAGKKVGYYTSSTYVHLQYFFNIFIISSLHNNVDLKIVLPF